MEVAALKVQKDAVGQRRFENTERTGEQRRKQRVKRRRRGWEFRTALTSASREHQGTRSQSAGRVTVQAAGRAAA